MLPVFRHLSAENLTEQLESDDALERSAAIRLLAQREKPDASLNCVFADLLKRETKLYTKIGVCEALQTGGDETALMLIPLLGTIGRNQHQQPSPEVFKKSSYPLPRDIVARILARMDPRNLAHHDVHHSLRTTGTSGGRFVDAVGFMCFYSPVTKEHRLAALRALINRLSGQSQ